MLSLLQIAADFYVDVFNAPFQGFFVRVEENVEPISADSSAAVEHLYGFIVVVSCYDHFSAEGEPFVSGCEGVTLPYFVTAGRDAVCEFTAAFSARTISGYAHSDGLPPGGDLRRSFHFRNIKNDNRQQNQDADDCWLMKNTQKTFFSGLRQ